MNGTHMRSRLHNARQGIRLLGLWGILALFGSIACAQDDQLPAPASVNQLAERLRATEENNKKLADQLEKVTREHDEQMKQLLQKFDELSGRRNGGKTAGDQTNPDGNGASVPPAFGSLADPDTHLPSADNPPGNADLLFPALDNQIADPGSPVPIYEPAHPHSPTKVPVPVGFGPGPGLQFMTADEQFRLQIHVQSQVEGRVWSPSDQLSAHDGFFFPRQRFFFVGNITKPIEYVFSMNRGLNGGVNILDSFLNFNFDERFQVRFGRYFTPLTYDQFAIRNLWLPTPERSLFTTNVGLSRQLGLMGWGSLFRKKFDYAAGFFNGSRNGFESLNNNLDFVGFINARPFQESETLWFAKYWNIGTSVSYGRQNQPAVPAAFRVGAVAPDASVPGAATVPFLTLNPDAIEKGGRLLGSVHSAYFFRSLTLMGEWQYGNIGYATLANPTPVSVPVTGYYATAAYFLTGEIIEKRDMVRPRRPLVPATKGSPRGIGAWEAVARVSELRFGQQIFSNGIADANLWSNSATTTELGMNWYWNEYLKFYMFWMHADFAKGVQYEPGSFHNSANLFWLRAQLYF